MSDAPLVTLVIPSFNPGHFLKNTLQSVAAQTLQNYECIVVDDGSDDNSLTYFQAAYKTNKRLKLIKHKVTSGVSAARNSGIRMARGTYIAFLDADDLLMPNSLEVRVRTCIAARAKSDQYAGSYCGSQTIEETFKGIPSPSPQSLKPIGFAQNGPTCPFNANQPMIRADILRAAGGFNEEMAQSEDYDLWLRIIRAGYWFAPAQFTAVTYRKRSFSQVRRAPMDHLKAALLLLNSGERPLSADQLAWSPYRVCLPYATYAEQRRKVQRILEFCGMNLASSSPNTVADLASLMRDEIPNAAETFPPHHDFLNMLLAGVRRQTGAPENKTHNTQAQQVIDLFFEQANNSKEQRRINPVAQPISGLWNQQDQYNYDYVFIPHKDYHVWTIALLRDELDRRGISFVIVDLTPQWREAGVRSMAQENNLPLIGLGNFILGNFAPSQLIVFNDWDPVTRPMVAAAKTAGIATTSIVEGIQDYEDADVHWKRQAYQLSQTVLLPGAFDQRYFEKPQDQQTTIPVGVARVQSLRGQSPKDSFKAGDTPRIMINCNFSYGVLVEHRDAWLTSAVKAVLAANMIPVISRHPADQGTLYERYVTDLDFYSCLESCQATIQRFASGVLESLARETPVFYFNPHGEKVDKFTADPMGAYCVVCDNATLVNELNNWRTWETAARTHGPAFLDHHTGPASSDIYAVTVDGLVAGAGPKANAKQMQTFKTLMRAIDQASMSLTRASTNGVGLIPDLENLPELMTGYQAMMRTSQNTTRLQVGPGQIGQPLQDDNAADIKRLVKELIQLARSH